MRQSLFLKAQREYHAKRSIGKEFRDGFDADLFLTEYNKNIKFLTSLIGGRNGNYLIQFSYKL